MSNSLKHSLSSLTDRFRLFSQVLGPEEAVAEDEFAKFEARLRSGGKTVEI